MTAPPASTELAIDVQGLNKSFGDKHVVKDFSIQVPRARITGFLGPNGSGKTTTLRMLCGLLTPDSGTGKCLGLDIVKQSDAIKLRVGYMTQKFSFYEDLSIRENLDFVARIYDVKDRRQVVDRAIERLGRDYLPPPRPSPAGYAILGVVTATGFVALGTSVADVL